MTTTTGETYLLECSNCGAKITQSGSVVGGNASCSPHKYGPVGSLSAPSPRRTGIVYPSDKERNWLRLVDENKLQNEQHSTQFNQDIVVLNKNKTTAMDQISSMIKSLRIKLDERHDQLEKELTLAFQERQNAIKQNIKQLKDHKAKNTETKENCEDLLVGNKQVTDREETIVSQCEAVVNTTPNIKYIETELRYTFDELESIQRRLSKFGTLHIKSMTSGLKCIFQSTLDAKNTNTVMKPRAVEAPLIKLNSTTFDHKCGKVKLVFKVKLEAEQNKDLDINIVDYLSINILCTPEFDDDDKNEDVKPNEETRSFKDCKAIMNGKKYELHVSHKFVQGITVAFKMRTRFESPDDDKYVSNDGKWSREQVIEIPEEDNHAIFNIELNGRSKRLSLDDDDVALTNFGEFERKFMRKFDVKLQQNEALVLRTNNGILNEKSKLAAFASDSVVIRGHIMLLKQEEPSPAPAYSLSPRDQGLADMLISPRVMDNQGKMPSRSTSPKVVSPQRDAAAAAAAASPKHTPPKESRKKPGADDVRKPGGPKQISSIVVYGDTKKRVVLKNNPKKNVYEYTMDTLRQKLLKKFQAKGLKGHFDLRIDNGSVIAMDQHIVQKLVNYKGEIQISQ